MKSPALNSFLTSFLGVVFAFLLLFFALLAVSKLGGPLFSGSLISSDKNLMTVMGDADASIAPDIAVVTAGVSVNDTTPSRVQQKANQSINAMVEGVKAVGIDRKYIQTSAYNINPRFNFEDGRQRPDGYDANITITVKVKDFTKIDAVLDKVTEQGATNVNGLTFDVEDKTKALATARKEAIDKAKEKASQLARESGVSLSRLVNVQVDEMGEQPVPMRGMALAEDAVMNQKTQVEPGEQKLTVRATLYYELK